MLMMEHNIKIVEIRNFEENFRYLHYGINLPILKKIKPLIRNEFFNSNVSSLVIMDKYNEIYGHTSIFDFQGTMFFGFFAVKDDNISFIKFLANNIQKLAVLRGCNQIIGPINLPTYIYGWGFSEEGSDKSIFAAGPYNDPVYGRVFQKLGFHIKHRIFKMKVPFHETGYQEKWKITLPDLEDETKYMEWYPDFIGIQDRLYAKNIKITPNQSLDRMIEYLKFSAKYGFKEMTPLIYDDGKLVGVGCSLPNAFDIGEDGKCKSSMMMGTAVEPDYQRKGVFSSILNEVIVGSYRNGLTHGECTVDAANTHVIRTFQKFGSKITRSHIVLAKNI